MGDDLDGISQRALELLDAEAAARARGRRARAGREAAAPPPVLDRELERIDANIERGGAQSRAIWPGRPAPLNCTPPRENVAGVSGTEAPASVEGARSPCPPPAFEGATSRGASESPATIDNLDGMQEEDLKQLDMAAAAAAVRGRGRNTGRSIPLKLPTPLAAVTPRAGTARGPVSALEGGDLDHRGRSPVTPASTKRARLQCPATHSDKGSPLQEAAASPATASTPRSAPSAPRSVYVLRLACEGCFYVGLSKNVNKRVQQHREGPKGFVLAKGGVVDTETPMTPRNPEGYAWEEQETVMRMMDHGFNNVRGSHFARVKLSKTDLEHVKRVCFSMGGLCYNCGSQDHFCSTCPGGTKEKWLKEIEALIAAADPSQSPATTPERATDPCRAIMRDIVGRGPCLLENPGEVPNPAIALSEGSLPSPSVERGRRKAALTLDRRCFAHVQGTGTFHLSGVLKRNGFVFNGKDKIWTWRPEQTLPANKRDQTFRGLETVLHAAATECGIELNITHV